MSAGQGGAARQEAPLEYSVRVSAKARHARLVMKPAGLEVVVPRGYSRRNVPALVERHRVWIERAAKRAREQRARLMADPPRLPDEISLPALGERWPVEYCSGPEKAARVRVLAKSGRLVVFGDKEDFERCKRALRRWLGRKGREDLVPLMAELAERHGLGYKRVTIRQQRSRWGSCTRNGDISLNAKLLLLPRAACEYVLVHELCHTVHMDHSPRFWALMARCDPEYKAHKRLIRESAKALPAWLDREPGGEAM